MFSFSCCHLNQELQDKSTKNLPKHIQKYFYIKYIIFKNIILICNYISKIYNFIKVEVSFYKEKIKIQKFLGMLTGNWKNTCQSSNFNLRVDRGVEVRLRKELKLHFGLSALFKPPEVSTFRHLSQAQPSTYLLLRHNAMTKTPLVVPSLQ